MANVLTGTSLLLYAYAEDVRLSISHEAATGLYAAGLASALVGFWRFFGRKTHWLALGSGTALLVGVVAGFHYLMDAYAWRSATTGLFAASLSLVISVTVLRGRKSLRSSHAQLFTATLAMFIALADSLRGILYFTAADEMRAALWDMLVVSIDAVAVPALSYGALMLVHRRMMAQVERAADHDFLTGAWSRSAFFEAVERELSRAKRTRHALSLLLIDVDHFKRINDSYGHAGGDQVLVDVALRAEAALRDIDYFARIGGEEFAALLPETDRYAAQSAAERLRIALDTKPANNEAGETQGSLPYTVSIGVATLRSDDSHSDLMRRADAALYTAKAIGRNRVVSESD